MRFGITPGAQTGQLGSGPQPPRIAEDPAKQVKALNDLRPDKTIPFVLRLHRFFWSDGEAGVQHFMALADRYTKAGFDVELQLRYHPSAQQEGDIPAWTAFVRRVVDRFGPNPRVVAIQVTNEVNLPLSPDSSDGAYAKGSEALVQGVLAAKDEARKKGYGQLEIGFNWAYRSTPRTTTTSGPTCATTAARSSWKRSTGSGSTPTPARSSRRRRRPAASATAWSTR